MRYWCALLILPSCSLFWVKANLHLLLVQQIGLKTRFLRIFASTSECLLLELPLKKMKLNHFRIVLLWQVFFIFVKNTYQNSLSKMGILSRKWPNNIAIVLYPKSNNSFSCWTFAHHWRTNLYLLSRIFSLPYCFQKYVLLGLNFQILIKGL